MHFQSKKRESGVVRVIVIGLAIIGLLTAAAAAANILYRKYRKYLASLNEDDSLTGMGEDSFEEDGEEEEPPLDCSYAE